MASSGPRHLLQQLRQRQEIGVAAGLFLICVVLSIASGRFLAVQNLLNIGRQASSYGIMAVGMVFLLSMGEVDLSVGSIVTLVNITAAVALRDGVPVGLAVLLGLGTGAACGLLNGLLSVWLRIPTIIVTLGTMNVFRGLALVLCSATPVSNFSKESLFFKIGSGGLLGIPAGLLVMIVIGILGHILFNHTPFGFRVQAIGSNLQAARFSGIPITRYRLAALTLMGLISSIAGIVELAFSESGETSTGLGFELLVIASAIIGGTSLSGGSGSILGGILGALLMAVISNGLVLLAFKNSTYWNVVIQGAVIIVAVAFGVLLKKR